MKGELADERSTWRGCTHDDPRTESVREEQELEAEFRREYVTI
jgi:hypothetical protein